MKAFEIVSDPNFSSHSRSPCISSKAASLPSLSSSSDTESIDIPQVLESVETLTFIGFVSTAASIIFNKYQESLLVCDWCELLDFIRGHIESSDDAASEDADWDQAILDMGIKPSIKDQILDPQLTTTRPSETARHWVLDTLITKFLWRKSLNTLVLGSIPKTPESLSSESGSPGPTKAADPKKPKPITRLEKSSNGQASKVSKLGKGKGPSRPPLLAMGTSGREANHDEIDLLQGGAQPRLTGAFWNQREHVLKNQVKGPTFFQLLNKNLRMWYEPIRPSTGK
ncbi:MAG: hypothetical protein Q9196_006267 [Gyalolechia fulgens]